jgi:hypothetical protein
MMMAMIGAPDTYVSWVPIQKIRNNFLLVVVKQYHFYWLMAIQQQTSQFQKSL